MYLLDINNFIKYSKINLCSESFLSYIVLLFLNLAD